MKTSVAIEVNARLNQVWHHWTSPDEIINWNFASEDWWCPAAAVELQPGGRFNYRMESKDGVTGFDYEGEFTQVIHTQCIVYRLDDGREVKIEFFQTNTGICIKNVFECESETAVEAQKQGWQAILNSFKKYVEMKQDLY